MHAHPSSEMLLCKLVDTVVLGVFVPTFSIGHAVASTVYGIRYGYVIDMDITRIVNNISTFVTYIYYTAQQ